MFTQLSSAPLIFSGAYRASVLLRPSILRHSYLIDVAYIPSAVRMMGAVQGLMARESSPPDFWEMAKEYEKIFQDYIPRLLESAATYFESTHFTDIISSMNHILSATAAFRNDIKGALDAHHITINTSTEELEGIFMVMVNELETITPPDKASGHAAREEMVDKVLDDTARELKKLSARYGIEEDVATYLITLKPQVLALIVAVGMSTPYYSALRVV